MIRPVATPAGPASPAAPARVEPLPAVLARLLRGRVVLAGIGNPLRGDDGVGGHVARELLRRLRLRPALPAADPAAAPGPDDGAEAVFVLDAEEVPESHIDRVGAVRPTVVLLLDAAEMGVAPGAVALLEGRALADATAFTHRTPLAPVARYLEHRTGATVLLLGIQPERLEWGAPQLTPAVAAAADRVVEILVGVLGSAPLVELAAGAAPDADAWPGACQAPAPEAAVC